jgi:opacity protein-like surface antigen
MRNQGLITFIFLSITVLPTLASGRSSHFMRGPAANLIGGYQNTSIAGLMVDENLITGVVFDYNAPLSLYTFAGLGIDGTFTFSKIHIKDKKGTGFALWRTFTGAGTARVGVVSGHVAFDINLARIMANWKGAIAYRSRTENDDKLVFGMAPGIGINTSLADNISMGINYRYEIFSRIMGGSFNGHTALAKLSYHF